MEVRPSPYKRKVRWHFSGQRLVVRWMCGVKLQDSVPNKWLRERMGLDDIISVLWQNRL